MKQTRGTSILQKVHAQFSFCSNNIAKRKRPLEDNKYESSDRKKNYITKAEFWKGRKMLKTTQQKYITKSTMKSWTWITPSVESDQGHSPVQFSSLPPPAATSPAGSPPRKTSTARGRGEHGRVASLPWRSGGLVGDVTALAAREWCAL